MNIKGLIDEDFVNYRLPAMYIVFPKCSFKCGAGCQNLPLAKADNINAEPADIARRYASNPITKAVVCAGLEPFDSFDDLMRLIIELRALTDDDIVIYTGYDKPEVNEYINILKSVKNVVVKFGRYIANTKPRYDEVLGVWLASPNQYAERIS